MNKLLIFSQDKQYTCFCRSIAIGTRNDTRLIGKKLKKILEEKGKSSDDLIKALGNSYRDAITRILDDKEIPNGKMIDKLTKYFEVENDYFDEKELQNVLITDNGIVIGLYDTNARAIEVKAQLDELIKERYLKNQPIVLEMPEK